jgi:hypothetical protein
MLNTFYLTPEGWGWPIYTILVNHVTMSGQPPMEPPKLSYKPRAERVREEEERARQEAEARPEVEPEFEPGFEPEEVTAPPPAPAPLEEPSAPDLVYDMRMPETAAPEEGPDLTVLEREAIEMLGEAEEEEVEEEEAELEEEAKPRRFPPRPPKSPDRRPIFAGFLLVGAGLAEGLYGLWAMFHSPQVSAGRFEDLVRWAYFSQGFIAAFLGAVAVWGGLWSFRKERFHRVKAGAIAGTVCIWALWIPWLVALLALLIIQRAREEYYPFYDPARDAPSWAKPPPRPVAEEEEVPEEETEEGEFDEVPVPAGAGT